MKYSYFTDIEEVAKWTYDHSERFKNSITRTGIWDGLIKLVEYGFVECVDEKNELYKLDFSYCKNFLEKYMSGQL